MEQEIRSSVITTSLLKKYKNKPIQSSVALRACFYRSIVSCSETPRATFHLFFSRGCLLLQLLLLCHPKPLKGGRVLVPHPLPLPINGVSPQRRVWLAC